MNPYEIIMNPHHMFSAFHLLSHQMDHVLASGAIKKILICQTYRNLSHPQRQYDISDIECPSGTETGSANPL